MTPATSKDGDCVEAPLPDVQTPGARRSPNSLERDGRGFATGQLWNEDGELVVSIAQEALVSRPAGETGQGPAAGTA